MDIGRWVAAALVLGVAAVASGNVVLEVQNKLKLPDRDSSLRAMRSHDVRRHGRLLSGYDLQLGGSGNPSETGLYFAKISIGTPPKDYFVQVDTGSDILWVNCADCVKCPVKSDLGIELTLYNVKESSSGDMVTCDQDFCTSTYNGPLPNCRPNLLCEYNVVYGDGSSTSGYFVKDSVHLDQVTGNLQTSSANGTVVFGCGSKQSGELGSSSEALDGILGFGQANSSIISQLASSGKVKKKFAHCLDGKKGGGIFAIGDVVQPTVKTTPLVPNQPHYNVIMKAVEVGGDVLQLPTDVFETGEQKGTIIDSGTTLAYLPEEVYNPMLKKILAQRPHLSLHTVEDQFTCFQYSGSVDDGFPEVTFHFEDSVTLTVYPHEYLFQIREDAWCFGWMSSGAQSKDGRDMTLLGDLVLSNKLVLYDLEKQAIGWTEYNCSSSIKVKDGSTGATYSVGAYDIGSTSILTIGRILTFLLLPASILHSLL
ncbi:aspartic proteinase-like protein 2 isoform X1 [Punica granatum]|uniref:Aspartic proteinase-like protein 2 isoform X1 n=2 Tax=Punica granatum TaxID=22663 RepID=A0A6P8DYD1_PUNGR|nr:aspartic proteinase-like protein 2 isoform X1 [Punica granatum]PKI45096.1 hypothetical protein CRG98_034480 [Punica granatum]